MTKHAKFAKQLPDAIVEAKTGTVYLEDIDESNVHLHLKGGPTDNQSKLFKRERLDGGQFAPGAESAQRAGGLAKKGKVALSVRLSLKDPEKTDMAEYYRAGEAYRKRNCADIRRATGDCGASVSGIVADAATALMWARYHSDEAMLTKDKTARFKHSLLALKFNGSHKDNMKEAWKLAKLLQADKPKDGSGIPELPYADDDEEEYSDTQPTDQPQEESTDAPHAPPNPEESQSTD